MTQDIPLAELAPRLVEAMLPHVPFDGWSSRALAAAEKEPPVADDATPVAVVVSEDTGEETPSA